MITIKRSTRTGKYYQRTTGNNNELLQRCQPLVQKESVWVNIASTAHNYSAGANGFIVRDASGKVPVDYNVTIDGQGKLVKERVG